MEGGLERAGRAQSDDRGGVRWTYKQRMRSGVGQGQDAQAGQRGWGGGRNLRGQRRRKGSKEGGRGPKKEAGG